jgi:hypothetical protein
MAGRPNRPRRAGGAGKVKKHVRHHELGSADGTNDAEWR